MAKWLHIAVSAVLAALWISVFVLKAEIPVLTLGLLSMTPFERVQIGVRFEFPPLSRRLKSLFSYNLLLLLLIFLYECTKHR